MSTNKPVLICDLDNTLYDWLGFFVPAIYGLIDEAARILRCDPETLVGDLRAVHQLHHDSEHPFALLETDIVRRELHNCSQLDALKILNPAFHAFNRVRKQNLRVYDGVYETLTKLRAAGILILAHTESKYFTAVDRICRLGLDQFFERIYCREEAIVPHPDSAAALRWRERVPVEKIRRLSREDVKPNVKVLYDICAVESIDVGNVIYVGDSMARDVLMSKLAGAYAVWAAYGATKRPELYEKLVRITHWSAEDVEREKMNAGKAKSIVPDFTCRNSFSEILHGVDRLHCLVNNVSIQETAS
jgi:phosphoglycolate phosphatase